MGGGKAGFNVGRSEFSQENVLDGDIEYQRSGGCFVTTKKAIFFALLAILALVAVGGFIYFYGPKPGQNEEDLSSDIEKLLNDSLYNTDGEDFRLPSNVYPIHYRLRIHPYLDEPTADSFTFTGQVTILIRCIKSAKKIVLHSEDLEIDEQDVTVAAMKSLGLNSLSQVLENAPERNATENIGLQSNLTEVNKAPPTTETLPSQPPQTSAAVASTSTMLSNNVTPNAVLSVIGISTPAINTVATAATLPRSTESLEPLNNLNTIIKSPITTSATSTPVPNIWHSEAFNNTSAASVKPTTTTVPPPKRSSSPNLVYHLPATAYVTIRRIEEIKQMSRYIIHLATAMEVGHNYTIDIKFSGKILNSLVGLYKTSYSNNEVNKRWILSTHFEPIFARRVFPCFDQPSFKSAFEISVARRTSMSAISNMPLKQSEPMINRTDWFWDHFETTPPMPPYLVAFTISDFESAKSASNPELNTSFTIWAPKHSVGNAQYATEIGPKIFSYLQNYFGVSFPLPKVDLVAVPELSQTAMENWGLITFRETALLLDPQFATWKTKNHIFKAITGKLTKQWFGNLVTMHWWSEYWLSEGFATYMEDVVENAIAPSLEDLDAFSLRIMQTILDSDKLKSVRSLHVDIKDPTQIEQLFDDVASNKGSCLIRMLNYTLTETLFKEAIQNYLRTWMYKSSTQDDLWESFEQVARNKTVFPSDLSIKDFMNSWIKQEGFPVVAVNRNYKTGNAVIAQSRFVHGDDTQDHLWYIPLTYTREYENGAVNTMWTKQEKTITAVNFTRPGNDSWVIFNINGAGLYRVNYDVTNWKLLKNQLLEDPEKISPSNRGQLLNDAFELANVGLLNYDVAFELSQYLGPKERNYIPWYSFFNSLKQLEYVIASTQYNGIFQQYVLKIIKPVYDELGLSEISGESQNNKLLRNIIIEVACAIDYEPCLQWAQQKYQDWMAAPEPDKSNPIPFAFRETVQCTAIKMGGRKEWDFLWQRTLYPSVLPINLKPIYMSLGCSRDPWLINSYLERSINGSIALHNARFVWKSIAHPVGLNAGFSFLRMNWKRIYDSYQHIFGIFTSIFEDFLSRLSTEIDLEDLTAFYKNHKKSMYPVSSLMLNVVERIKWRIYWSKSHLQTVVNWLSKNN